jgi:acetolactate synthase I/II/III large subunit
MGIGDVAEGLTQLGVQRVFAVPGGGASLELLDMLSRSGTDVVTPHHEAVAAVMAGVGHRVTDQIAATCTIKGPGVANLVPGLACCRLERWPVIAISEAFGPGTEPAIVHKRMDHRVLTAGAVKAHGIAASHGDVEQAGTVALDDEPGPVALDLVPNSLGPGFARAAISKSNGQMDRSGLARVESARRPIVIAGTAALRNGWGPSLEQLNVPIFTTAAAKGLVDERLRHSAGVYTGVGLELAPERRLLAEADLIVGFGLRSSELLKSTTHDVPTVLVDDRGSALSEGIDASATLANSCAFDVIAALSQRNWGDGLVHEVHQHLRRRLAVLGFSPATLLPDVEEMMAVGTRLVVDTGDFCTVAEHVWRAHHRSAFIGTGQSRYMGMGIPMALGAAIADSDRITILAVGDGGIGSHFGELSLAVERKLPLLVLFMSDGGMSSIIGRALATGRSTSFLERRHQWWRFAAEGLAMHAATVSSQDGALDVISSWKPDTGPLFVECSFPIDSYRAMSTNLR